jgi:hypothetical protein
MMGVGENAEFKTTYENKTTARIVRIVGFFFIYIKSYGLYVLRRLTAKETPAEAKAA